VKKYFNLWERWNIDSSIVFNILEKYDTLLSDEIKKLKNEWMKLPKYFKDRRTDEEYIYDIIDWWVIEDIICDVWLKQRLLKINDKIKVKLMGADNNRVIEKYKPNNITTEPDIVYSINNFDVWIELQMARKVLYSGYDMKEWKVKRAIKDDSYFLWIIIPNNEFFIIRPKDDMINMKTQSNPLWGGKIVYHITKDFINSIGGYWKMNEDLSEFYISKLKNI